jgi:hypothetical protein
MLLFCVSIGRWCDNPIGTNNVNSHIDLTIRSTWIILSLIFIKL